MYSNASRDYLVVATVDRQLRWEYSILLKNFRNYNFLLGRPLNYLFNCQIKDRPSHFNLDFEDTNNWIYLYNCSAAHVIQTPNQWPTKFVLIINKLFADFSNSECYHNWLVKNTTFTTFLKFKFYNSRHQVMKTKGCCIWLLAELLEAELLI